MSSTKITIAPFFENYLRCIIAGPSFSGKSELCANILRKRKDLFQSNIDHVIWYNTHSTAIPNISDVVDIKKHFYMSLMIWPKSFPQTVLRILF